MLLCNKIAAVAVEYSTLGAIISIISHWRNT